MIPSEKIPSSRIDGVAIVLLPYTPALVPIYHGWMQSPDLLAATESERLTLEQEYANQQTWAVDPLKYCWIVHSRRPVIRTFADGPGIQTPFGVDYSIASQEEAEALKKRIELREEEEEEEKEGSQRALSPAVVASPTSALSSSVSVTAAAASPTSVTEVSSSSTAARRPSFSSTMAALTSSDETSSSSKPPKGGPYPLTPIGDVNLFLHPDFNLEDYGISGGGCEIELMIAETQYRRRGLGEEAVRLAMEFSASQLGVERFVAKILQSNTPSLHLFEKKLGFRIVEYVKCFDEVVLFKDTSMASERHSFWDTEKPAAAATEAQLPE